MPGSEMTTEHLPFPLGPTRLLRFSRLLDTLPRWAKYVFAFVFTVAVIVLRLSLGLVVGDIPMLAGIPVILSAYVGGMGPGLLSLAVALLAGKYFFLPTVHSLAFENPKSFLTWLSLLIIGVLITALIESLHRARRMLEADIARRELAEENLRESEDRYRSLVEHAADAIYLIDETGRFLDVNPEAEHQTGYCREELLSMSVLELDEKKTPESLARFVAKLRSEGKDSLETRHRRRDGSSFPVEIISARLMKDGRMHMLAVVRDITKRKRAEEALQGSEKRFRDLFEHSTLGIALHELILDQASLAVDYRVTAVNQGYTRILGIEKRTAEGSLASQLYGSGVPPYLDCYAKAVESGEPCTFETYFPPLDKHFHIVAFAIGANRFATMFEDITEAKRMKERMIQSEKMVSVGGLAAGMAHEINNPLSGILQGAQVVLGRLRDDIPPNRLAALQAGCDFETISSYAKARDVVSLVEGMRDTALRAAKIVQDMLAFCRQSNSNTGPASLASLLENAVDLYTLDCDLKGDDFRAVHIVRDYQLNTPLVQCSCIQIEQVLINILRNSAQALQGNKKEDSPPPTITLRTRHQEGYVAVEIEDNGPGMDESTRKRVFEPFFTTKDPGVGTGLGLFVSYFIITSTHKGSLEVESSPGRGARFILRLPLTPQVEAQGEFVLL